MSFIDNPRHRHLFERGEAAASLRVSLEEAHGLPSLDDPADDAFLGGSLALGFDASSFEVSVYQAGFVSHYKRLQARLHPEEDNQ